MLFGGATGVRFGHSVGLEVQFLVAMVVNYSRLELFFTVGGVDMAVITCCAIFNEIL